MLALCDSFKFLFSVAINGPIAIQLVLIGKDAICKGNIRNVRNWSQAMERNFSRLFTSKIAKIAKDKCSHCVIALDYSLR